MHNKSIVIYGEQGTGKTIHSEALRQHFKLNHIVEARGLRAKLPEIGALILTNETPTAKFRDRSMHIAKALEILKTKPAGYPF